MAEGLATREEIIRLLTEIAGRPDVKKTDRAYALRILKRMGVDVETIRRGEVD